MREKLLYPDYYRDAKRMRAKLQGLEVDVAGGFLRTGLLQSRFAQRQMVGALARAVVDRTEWGMLPYEVNAYYDPSGNEIVFPAAIFEPPFFDPQRAQALNYGAIGAVIGHELSHGFDNSGRLYDAQGNLRTWWTARATRGFERRAQCFVRKFDHYQLFPDKFVNGQLTLGENIADAGGIRLAWYAFQQQQLKRQQQLEQEREQQEPGQQQQRAQPPQTPPFTQDQLFFLGYARNWCSRTRTERALYLLAEDAHAPSPFRVRGVVQSMAEFRQAFSCPKAPTAADPTNTTTTTATTDQENCWIW